MSIDAKVCHHHFHLNGIDCFRGQAEAVQLGDGGEKKRHGARQSHLAVQASVPRALLTIERATQVDLHGVAIRSSDIGAGLAIPGVGALDAAALARQLEDQTLSLVRLECRPEALIAAANDLPDLIAALRRAGDAARLVHQTFVVLEMKTALNFTRAVHYEASGSAASWRITASGGGSRTVVTLAPGATFAYLLLQPEWQAHRDGPRIGAWQEDTWRPPRHDAQRSARP